MLYPIQNDVRSKLDISGIWDFRADPDNLGREERWYLGLSNPRPMAVPGSWNEQYEDLFGHLGLSWYVTKTYVSAGWRGQRVMLRVGSACYQATVYVNGIEVGSHEGGHLPFEFEITDQVRWDRENVVAISVENELKPARVPSGNIPSPLRMVANTPRTTFDFYPFAGLHRPVVLYTTPMTHIEDVTVVTDIRANDGVVGVTVKLNAPITANGVARLRGGDTVVEQPLAFTQGVARAELVVPSARLWSDQDPYLYDLSVHADQDHYSLAVGVRTVAVQGGKILLNGRPVQLNGFGRHEDFYASGKGLNMPLMVKDYQLMRWTGANSYRTSHYPYSEEEMQLADREGFLIIDEIPAVSLQFDNPENMAERKRMCLQQIDELVARDKNHPSVLMWCVANEPMPRSLNLAGAGSGGGEADPAEATGKAFLDELLTRARQLDPTRLVTLVTIMNSPSSWVEYCDVVCMNRYWGWYVLGGELEKALVSLEQELDATWEKWGKPVILSEFGADTIPGLHGHPALMWTEEYQADLIRGHLRVAATKPYIAGMQIWNYADFAAVQSVMRVGGVNMKGVFTRARAPKMAAHVLREFWAKDAKK